MSLVWLAAASVVGALLALPLPFADHVPVAIAFAIGTALSLRERPQLRALAAAALVLFVVYTHLRIAGDHRVVPTRTERFTAIVLMQRTDDSTYQEYVLALAGGPRVLATFNTRVPLGARVLVRGRLQPLDDARNPGEPSERSIEAEHGIEGRLSGASVLRIESLDDGSLAARVARAHALALAALRAHLPEPGASIVAGELWGERAALPPDLRKEFQETGTVHVLVTAGLHVGLIAWLIVVLGRRLTLPRWITCLAAIFAVWSFAWFSGNNLPALRAGTMASAMLLARACGRSSSSWNTLAIAALATLSIDPRDAATPSFWLSFMCISAIFVWVPRLEPFAEQLGMPKRLREPLLLTIATQLGTWPITAAVFLQFSTYALVANLAVVPLVPVTMLLGFAQLACTPVAPLAQAFANLNSSALAWDLGAVHLLASLPDAIIRVTPAPTWCIAAYEGGLTVAALLVSRGAFTPALALALSATSLVLMPPLPIDTHLRITVLDVGQADSIVIQTPMHRVILIDAGGRLERGSSGEGSVAERVGERIVVPFLLRQGIHRIDALIISHPHGDHVGGCAPVLRALRVTEVADGGQKYGGHAYRDCLTTASKDGTPVVQPRAGLVWRTNDGITLTFLGPSLPFIGGRNAINDNSVTFMLQYRSFRMLFTGDAGVAAERRFLREGIDLHADVLKVGHHGSAYSSSPAFISAVHPTCAIISVGRHNLFGHPAPSTVARLLHYGATVYRTDQNAAVTIDSDGISNRVEPIIFPATEPSERR